MLPRFTPDNRTDVGLRDTKPRCNTLLELSLLSQLSDLAHNTSSQFRRAYRFSVWCMASMLLITIRSIVQGCTQKKMVRSYAWRIIAMMTYKSSRGNRPKVHFPTDPVSRPPLPVWASNDSISIGKLTFEPYPTGVCLLNISPESYSELSFSPFTATQARTKSLRVPVLESLFTPITNLGSHACIILLMFALLQLFSVTLQAQTGNTLMLTGAGAPSGNCAFMFLYTNSTNADFYNCLNGAWNKVTSVGGGGNVSTTQTNVYGAFLQDFTAATMELPEAAAFVTNVDSTIGVDTNTLITHIWGPGPADSFNVVTSSTSTTTTQPIFATATAGLYAPRAIAAGDLPTTLTSGTAITNAALTTPTLGTPASGTLTNATGLPMNGLVGATAANTITETAVLRPTTFAGIETANLTYPWVFQNTNSANSNTSGALLVNCAGTDPNSTCMLVNSPSAAGSILLSLNTGGTVTNGVISSQTVQWSVTGGGAVTQLGAQTVPAGTVSGATYTFTGDTANAGWYRPAAATYAATNGTNEFLRLSSTGMKTISGGAFGMTASSTSSTGSFDTCWDRAAAGTMRVDTDSACSNGLGKVQAQLYTTTTNCAAAGSAANPSVAACGAASSGSFSCATNASTGTCVVNTTAVTANSVIIIQEDDSLGTKLSVTCNTSNISPASAPISARSAATSFTINLGTITTNPECFSYFIIN